MKKIGSKLFEKFEDAKILNETFKKIQGGLTASIENGPGHSGTTGDTESTQNGCDCGDNVATTDAFKDSNGTVCGQDN
jgi:hypothetical protein